MRNQRRASRFKGSRVQGGEGGVIWLAVGRRRLQSGPGDLRVAHHEVVLGPHDHGAVVGLGERRGVHGLDLEVAEEDGHDGLHLRGQGSRVKGSMVKGEADGRREWVRGGAGRAG